MVSEVILKEKLRRYLMEGIEPAEMVVLSLLLNWPHYGQKTDIGQDLGDFF